MNYTLITIVGLILIAIAWGFHIYSWTQLERYRTERKGDSYQQLKREVKDACEIVGNQTKVLNSNTDQLADVLRRLDAVEKRLGQLELKGSFHAPPAGLFGG